VTNIVESIDVGVPIRLAYNQWTQFADFPSFMKKVESVETADEDQKLNWKAQVLWSHRTWEATIQEQSPDDKIVWRSKGAKGHVDGAVTFHELAPNLTRVLLALEYHPQGLFEHTGNIWRAQGRRARLARRPGINSETLPVTPRNARVRRVAAEGRADHWQRLRTSSEPAMSTESFPKI
jgi:hypothetical protein